MKFGPVPVDEAEGAILAHSVAVASERLRKGITLGAAEVAALRGAGLQAVIVARLEEGDLHENEAAELLAQALPDGPGIHLSAPFTGRVNLLATGPGVVRLDVAHLNAANAVDPMLTVATVPDCQQVSDGAMIATVKVIAYGLPADAVAQAARVARGSVRLCPPVCRTASLIVTYVAGGVGDKGRAAIAARLEALSVTLCEVLHCPHEERALSARVAEARGDVVLILTASATSDPMDTGPQAVRLAGGQIERFGMPVDPGNLLFLGKLGARPVIGLPGCARSPALNGADWVLSRVVCGIEVTAADIAGMGVGGLLKEIPSRPQPRHLGGRSEKG